MLYNTYSGPQNSCYITPIPDKIGVMYGFHVFDEFYKLFNFFEFFLKKTPHNSLKTHSMPSMPGDL